MFKFLKNKFISIPLIIILLFVAFFIIKTSRGNGQDAECNLVKVRTGDLERTYSITGRVSSTNSTDITTNTTGLVKEVYVKDGDVVISGQKIALLELDQQSQLIEAKNKAAYLTMLSAYESVTNGRTALDLEADTAGKNLTVADQNRVALQAAVDTAQKSVIEAEDNLRIIKKGIYIGSTNALTLKKYSVYDQKSAELALKIAKENLTTAEQNLAMADTNINLAQKQLSLSQDKQKSSGTSLSEASANLKATRLAYDLSGPVVRAPISGVVKGVKVLPGTVVRTTPGSTAGFKLANIENPGKPLITASASEAEILFLKNGQQAKISFDAISNKQFNGKIIATNNISSANDNYEVTLELDDEVPNLLPNLSADIDIIPEVKKGVLLVPTTALEEKGDKVLVKKNENGKLVEAKVEIGDESDTLTEIKTGLKEGDSILVNFFDKKKVSESCEK